MWESRDVTNFAICLSLWEDFDSFSSQHLTLSMWVLLTATQYHPCRNNGIDYGFCVGVLVEGRWVMFAVTQESAVTVPCVGMCVYNVVFFCICVYICGYVYLCVLCIFVCVHLCICVCVYAFM